METDRRDISRNVAIGLLVLILLLGAALRLPGISDPFGRKIEGWSGAFYSTMARNCLALSTAVPYLNPDAAGEPLLPYLNHPPATVWLVAGSFALLGESEFAARLPFLMASLLSIVFIYRLGTRCRGRIGGVITAIFLATTPVAVVYAAQVEVLGAFFLLCTLGVVLAHIDFYRQTNVSNVIRLAVWTILALLADWPSVLLIGVLQVHVLVRMRQRWRHALAWTGFSGLVFAGLLTWMFAASDVVGADHLWEKVWQRSFSLVTDSTGTDEGRSFGVGQLLWRYLRLHWTVFGWVLLLPGAAWLVCPIEDRFRSSEIPIVLCSFALGFYLLAPQGHHQHDFWSHAAAAGYALAAAAGLLMLRLKRRDTLWIAALIAIAGISATSSYRSRVIPTRSGSDIADSHFKVEELIGELPAGAMIAVEDDSHWPTLAYYLQREFVAVQWSNAGPESPAGPSFEVVPWWQYLVTHAIVPRNSDSYRRLAEFQSQPPVWLVTRRDLVDASGVEQVASEGGWTLHELGEVTLNSNLLSPIVDGERSDVETVRTADVSSLPATDVSETHPTPFLLSRLFQLLALVGLFLVTALSLRVSWRPQLLRVTGNLGDWLTRRRWVPPIVCGVTAVVLAGTMSMLSGVRQPLVHDEFAYLLMAETFLDARVANEQHSLWEHFESMHIFHEPVYAAKYPPAQGLALAAGTLFGGHPIVGVWIIFGLACGAMCWCLQACLPRRWALLGGLLSAFNPALLSQWGNSYWGGAVAMLGGALVYGGLIRTVQRPNAWSSIALAAGLVILANSRPFEGLVVSLPAVAVLIGCLLRKRSDDVGDVLRKIVLPAAVVGVPAVAAMLYYNLRLTGDPWKLPYLHHAEEYSVAPNFLWQSLRTVPDYRHEQLRELHLEWELSKYESQRVSITAFLQHSLWKSQILAGFFIGAALLVASVSTATAMSNRWIRLMAAGCALLCFVFLFHTFLQPHYAAPATVLAVGVLVQSLRCLRTYRVRNVRIGQFVVAGLLGVAFLSVPIDMTARWELGSRLNRRAYLTHCLTPGTRAEVYEYLSASGRIRHELVRELTTRGGKHLVVVQYGNDHNVLFEWVWNSADIDTAQIVWARDMGPEGNRDLLEYYRNRQVWYLDVDTGFPEFAAAGVDGQRAPESSVGITSFVDLN
ncbi:MAG: hypothetical protein DWQ34_03370 [Planctomycetota bacterium]|nr:MAG: hypothetical protein DWQ34_03370 [Planctomycetota bacterium]REK25152.1 MAG: hypothetical protein DWQ41_12615 [Planctomycetota bacterium]REK38793.1 MAG: hypothetical protein DWQ45_02800 [Planctomycetota bacterium]